MSERTATPWRVGVTLLTAQTRRWTPEERAANDEVEARNVFAFFSAEDEGRRRERVAQCFGPDAPANAAFIVRAVNAHEELVAALRALWPTARFDQDRERARAILAKLDAQEKVE